MSQLKLTAEGGGGTVAIKGPASTTGNAAIELTVPGTGNGTILTSNSSTGKILQVVSTNVTTTSSSVISDFPTLVESPASITFNSVGLNSHFVISGQVGGEANSSDHVVGFVLQRIVGGVTTNINVGATAGNRASLTAIQNQGYSSIDNASTPSSNSFAPYRDSPNQAAGTSIKYVFSVCKINQTGTITYYFGRSTNDSDTGDYERLPQHITVMEIAA